MCLAIPMKLIERDELSGTAELQGVRRRVSLMLLPEARVGDQILIHAGFAIATVDPEEAAETVRLFDALREAEAAEADDRTSGETDASPAPPTSREERA
ncbi:MAG: HypC/HybG/HupF family hydrogenase formation chaperone [Candidatus Eisenbacteria bacterium]|nr:HypC/HybG/HupF family hydrogenase formation chaperone [Candidatus Eisenbacteria bacterium]